MSVFEYESYKKFVNSWVSEQPKAGYGVFSRMAEHLTTNSVTISQIFKGERDLSLEQAAKLCQFLGLGTLESDFFLLLVQRHRAGSDDLKRIFTRQLDELRLRGQAIKNRIAHEQLSDQDKAIFYSSWYFIATWLAATLPEYSSMQTLARHFNVPENTLSDVMGFLLSKGLLVRKNGRIEFGTNVIHVPHDSPFVVKHHMNWRMKAIQAMDQRKETNLHYSSPMLMSNDVRKKMREELVQFIQRQTKKVADSKSESLVCLNIDFFDY